MSEIEWTDETWNPVTGCSHVSEGCRHCYAEKVSLRYGYTSKAWTAQNAAENVTLHDDRLDHPLHWKRGRMVFVNSMSDLFHELVPFEFIDEVFAVMAVTPEHTYQVLTKRPERMRQYMDRAFDSEPTVRCLEVWRQAGSVITSHGSTYPWPLPNVWLGVSCEDQKNADERIPVLLQTPAAVRFISAEPLLGPIDLSGYLWGRSTPCTDSLGGTTCPKDADCECGYRTRAQNGEASLDWVIAGGESQPRCRPMDLDWARSLRDQCVTAGVPFFLKQLGGFPNKRGHDQAVLDGERWNQMPQAKATV